MNHLEKYNEWKFKMSSYQMALAIIGIDKMTVAPVNGASYRDKRTAYLAGELFSIQTDKNMLQVLKAIQEDESIEDYIRKEASLYEQDLNKTLCIPKDEFVEFAELCDASYDAWHKAKLENNYAIFEPYLKKVIETKKKFYGYRKSDLPLYDQMLDDFEPGMNIEKYDEFFHVIKEYLVPLIQEVTKAKQIDTSFLEKDYPIELQKKFMDDTLLKYLSFDSSWGYQNETEHPFTSWTCEQDCRVTTKYIEDNVISAIFSTIHETGHAWYEHNIDPKYDGAILSEGVSSGMHESQSRFCENYLGRNKAFWMSNYEKLQSLFKDQLEHITLDQFIDAINASKPSLVRTEADELTYPIHILIRYEIEKGLFDGTISTEGLDQTWNKMYKEYLGVDVTSATDGILQDVHWSDGSFGYFPTYALGSAYAAQFYDAMKKDINIEESLANGRYIDCINWLKENVQQYGCRYDADTILKKATGKGFDPMYYVKYLEDKYRSLYHL